MSKVQRFEDLVAWKKARVLAAEVYKATRQSELARDFGLRDQMQRAAVSIMSNIAEGFDRKSRKEFHHFLCIAKASCAEVRSQLYLASDIGYLSSEQFQYLPELSDELSRIIGGLRASIERQL